MKYTRIKDPKNSSHIATHEKVEKIKVTKDHNICKIEGDIIASFWTDIFEISTLQENCAP